MMGAAEGVMKVERGESWMLDLPGGARCEWVWLEVVGFWVARYKVTNRQYRAFDPDHRGGVLDGYALDGDDQPAVRVSWDHARQFAVWLDGQAAGFRPAGFRIRLPREPEWESYAKCEVVKEPLWGDRCPGFGSYEVIERMRIGWGPTVRVQDESANAWGLHGVEGGLWEWSADVFDPTMNCRILRGACWYGVTGGEQQLLYHRTGSPDAGHVNFGFRLVLAPGEDVPGRSV